MNCFHCHRKPSLWFQKMIKEVLTAALYSFQFKHLPPDEIIEKNKGNAFFETKKHLGVSFFYWFSTFDYLSKPLIQNESQYILNYKNVITSPAFKDSNCKTYLTPQYDEQGVKNHLKNVNCVGMYLKHMLFGIYPDLSYATYAYYDKYVYQYALSEQKLWYDALMNAFHYLHYQLGPKSDLIDYIADRHAKLKFSDLKNKIYIYEATESIQKSIEIVQNCDNYQDILIESNKQRDSEQAITIAAMCLASVCPEVIDNLPQEMYDFALNSPVSNYNELFEMEESFFKLAPSNEQVEVCL